MSNSPRYGTNTSNTSKYMQDLLNEFIKMPKGVFNLNRRKIQDVSPYAITPIESWEMLPNSDVYLKYDIQMLSKNPTVKRLLSGMTAELRVYKCNYNDCWEGWNNFITKGRSGKVSKSIPYVDLTLGTTSTSGPSVTTSLPYNPMEYLRHAPCVHIANTGTGNIDKYSFSKNHGVLLNNAVANSSKVGSSLSNFDVLRASTAMRINALPYVGYNKIVKAFQPSNLLQNNPHWYPENEAHDMILPYSAEGPVSTSDYDNPTKKFVNGTSRVLIDAVNSGTDDAPVYESYPWLNVLQFAQRKGDYFNTGSPFPDLIRGDIPTLDILGANIDWDDVLASENLTPDYLSVLGIDTVNNKIGAIYAKTNGLAHPILAVDENGSTLNYAHTASVDDNAIDLDRSYNSGIKSENSIKVALSKAVVQGLNFSMAQWRYLATMTVMRERMALTDGSYNQLVKAMFGHNPKWHNHDAVYCGGTRQPIVFSEVVNTTESDNAPLGDVAGRAVSSSNHDVIHVHSDDYGFFMTVLVITPDTYYSQGVDKMWSRLQNAEQYFPILNNLSPDAILNKELFVSGDNTVDEDIFNHQERFAFYKSRRNEVSGLLSLAISKIGDIGAWVMQRIFSGTPQFNAQFNRGSLTDNEKAVFASVDQAEFNVVIGSNMRFIAPIPEDSRPSDMGISY